VLKLQNSVKSVRSLTQERSVTSRSNSNFNFKPKNKSVDNKIVHTTANKDIATSEVIESTDELGYMNKTTGKFQGFRKPSNIVPIKNKPMTADVNKHFFSEENYEGTECMPETGNGLRVLQEVKGDGGKEIYIILQFFR